MTATTARARLAEGMRRLDAMGLNRGTSGNLSTRQGKGFLITPSGVAPADLKPAAMVSVGLDGDWRRGARPSSEWRFHRDIYTARPDAKAIVHVHSLAATALACLRRDIPAFHYMVAVAGGNSIRCARYATFGSQALSNNVVAALDERQACLLANHGMITTAADIDRAIALAVEVEALADQYLKALQVGRPVLLSRAEMSRVLKKFETYGQKSSRSDPD